MQPVATARKLITTPHFALLCVISVLFLLPRVGPAAAMAGSAAVLSAYVWAAPDRFRDRRNSLKPALTLAAIMWILTALITIMTWTDALE